MPTAHFFIIVTRTKLPKIKRAEEMDARIDDYYRKNPVPIGSTDRKRAIDIESLFGELNREDSDSSSLWAEK